MLWEARKEVGIQFNVARLLKEPVGSTRFHRFDNRFTPLGDEGELFARGAVLLTRVPQGVLASGTVEAAVQNTCSRCLVLFCQWQSVKLDEVYLQTADVATGTRLKPAEDQEDGLAIDEHRILDLTEALRQYAAGVASMKPLCQPGCPGICQRCGADLREGPCQCTVGEDPRWSPLRQLFSGAAQR